MDLFVELEKELYKRDWKFIDISYRDNSIKITKSHIDVCGYILREDFKNFINQIDSLLFNFNEIIVVQNEN